MLKRKQIIGANFSFQHHPFGWTVGHLRAMGFDRMELWGIAPHLDLFHGPRRRLAEVKAILDDNGLAVYIASGGSALHTADICAELSANDLFPPHFDPADEE